MARQNIGIGASANDGTGDTLRVGGDKINDNFIELYDTLGWGNYSDAATTPATQTFTTTPAKLQIDGGGSASNSSYLPREIRGSAELWDTTNDKITPIDVGDTYDCRVSIRVTSKTGTPNVVILKLDIGGSASPTNVILEAPLNAGKTAPFTLTYSFPIFCLSTFIANGGQVFLETDIGSVTVSTRSIFLQRNFKGDL